MITELFIHQFDVILSLIYFASTILFFYDHLRKKAGYNSHGIKLKIVILFVLGCFLIIFDLVYGLSLLRRSKTINNEIFFYIKFVSIFILFVLFFLKKSTKQSDSKAV